MNNTKVFRAQIVDQPNSIKEVRPDPLQQPINDINAKPAVAGQEVIRQRLAEWRSKLMLNEHDLKDMAPDDPVNHPRHYTKHPSGVECIEITQHMGFNLGNALKYIWRCDLKLDAIEDLKKAKWYVDKEIEKRTNASNAT